MVEGGEEVTDEMVQRKLKLARLFLDNHQGVHGKKSKTEVVKKVHHSKAQSRKKGVP